MSFQPDRSGVDRIARECLAVRARILNRAVTNLYDRALRPLGMKVSQMNILVATAMFGVARPGQICDALHMDASTLSRNAERMMAQGWLEVVPGDDGRAQPLRVTTQGMKLLKRATPLWERAQAQARTILGERGVTLLVESAGKLKNVESHE
jgi:DNA-binding MarR family transcriptional regulator